MEFNVNTARQIKDMSKKRLITPELRKAVREIILSARSGHNKTTINIIGGLVGELVLRNLGYLGFSYRVLNKSFSAKFNTKVTIFWK